MSFKYNHYFRKTLSAITEVWIAKQRRKNFVFSVFNTAVASLIPLFLKMLGLIPGHLYWQFYLNLVFLDISFVWKIPCF
jgi:hypothetical protein